MADAKVKAARLTPPMIELLTDIATHPQMYVGTYGRWGRTASALRSRGLATTEMIEGNQTEVIITDAGRAEATRRGLVDTGSQPSAVDS